VRTDFLPDARRAAAEEELRAQLKKEYTLRQQVSRHPDVNTHLHVVCNTAKQERFPRHTWHLH
jgi:hypothetical protein